MKKNSLLIIACLSTACIQTMEIIPEKKICSWSTKLGSTIINVNKAPISSIVGKVNIIGVGRNQQRTLQEPSFGDSHNVGEIDCTNNSILYEKNKEDESASDDDSYHPFNQRLNKSNKLWEHAQKIAINSPMITIIEPRITEQQHYSIEQKKVINASVYYFAKEIPDHEYGGISGTFKGELAITEAAKDLKICIEKILEKGIKMLKNNKSDNKSIALQALSTEVGFPREKAIPITILTVLSFIIDNPNSYDRIELFVKKRSEFKEYQSLLSIMVEALSKKSAHVL